MECGRLGFHLLDVQDREIRVQEGDVQGHVGVGHPDSPDLLVFKDEEHSGTVGDLGAVHEAPFPVGVGSRHLRGHCVCTENDPGFFVRESGSGGCDHPRLLDRRWPPGRRWIPARPAARGEEHRERKKREYGADLPGAARRCHALLRLCFPRAHGSQTCLAKNGALIYLSLYALQATASQLARNLEKNDADAQAMVDPELIQILVCPESKQLLEEADADLVRRISVAVAAGAIRNRAGEVVREPLDGGLVREDGKLLYPVREGIPIMLIDEAIALGDIP